VSSRRPKAVDGPFSNLSFKEDRVRLLLWWLWTVLRRQTSSRWSVISRRAERGVQHALYKVAHAFKGSRLMEVHAVANVIYVRENLSAMASFNDIRLS
jgi:hypothetical protein